MKVVFGVEIVGDIGEIVKVVVIGLVGWYGKD